jgi:hypothetical protein
MYVSASDGLGQVTRPPGDPPLAALFSSVRPRVLTYSTRDVIDKRISIPAQHSLVRLSKNPATRAEAVGMLAAVKAGRLAGIYCVNWKVPAQRALKLGKSWWTVIPPGEDAILMLDPDNPSAGQPLIAFCRELDPDCGLIKGEKRFAPARSRLDVALRKVWASYRLWQSCHLPLSAAAPSLGAIQPAFAVPASNILPVIFCRQRPSRSLPRLVSTTKVSFVPALPILSAGFCVRIEQGDFAWIFAQGPCTIEFPQGAERGIWSTGFVQNSISEDFEIKYQNNDIKRYRVRRQLNDIDPVNLNLPFFPPFAAQDPIRQNGQVFSNPGQFFHTGTSSEQVDFNLMYSDAPCLSVDLKLGGAPSDELEFLRRQLTFRTFLVSQSASGAMVMHAFSDQYVIDTRVYWRATGGGKRELLPATTIRPSAPQFHLVTAGRPAPRIVTTCDTPPNPCFSTDASRKEFRKLGVSTQCHGPCHFSHQRSRAR